MAIDKKILNEIERYNSINNYIFEQDANLPDLGALAPETNPEEELPTPEETTAIIDVEADPEVEKIDDKGESLEKEEGGVEELEITDLVDSQKKIEQKQEDYFNNLFNQLNNLQSKLSEMDNIVNKLNAMETKIEMYREKTPEEKLELRSYDSKPFNQKLSQFFDDKKEEMELTGKHDYVLTPDEVEDINVTDIKSSFQSLDNPNLEQY